MSFLLDLAGKLFSRKFLISAGATAGAMVLGNLLMPEVLDRVGPYIWAGIAIAAVYVLVEGIPDAVVRIMSASAQLIRARAVRELADAIVEGKVPVDKDTVEALIRNP